MSDWIQVKGIVREGYGVASGRSENPRFPRGTIEMQKPFFREQGLDLEELLHISMKLKSRNIHSKILSGRQTIQPKIFHFLIAEF